MPLTTPKPVSTKIFKPLPTEKPEPPATNAAAKAEAIKATGKAGQKLTAAVFYAKAKGKCAKECAAGTDCCCCYINIAMVTKFS